MRTTGQEQNEGGETTRLLIVAAYASVRAGLHALLDDGDEVEAGLRVIEEVIGSDELERVLPALLPDVVVCDDNEDDRARIVTLLAGGGAGLVLLTDETEAARLLFGADLPGWAVLPREADGSEIRSASLAVAAGLIVLDRQAARALTQRAAPSRTPEADALPGEALTAREREVLQHMAEGLANKQIAARLHISLHTVKFHVASILARLGATSRTEAVTMGARRGYVLL